MKSLHTFLTSALLATVLLTSCGPEGGQSSSQVVEWSALTQLDTLSHRVATATEADQKTLLQQAHTLINDLKASVPNNVQDRAQVSVLLQDLTSLSTKLQSASALSSAEVAMYSQALAPLVKKMSTAAGVPQSCASCSSCSAH